MKISNSPIRSCLWALAFTCTSAVALPGVAAAQADLAPAMERALALELELAKKRDLYLVLHLAERRLEIRARGVALDAIELTDVALTRYTPFGAAGEPPAVDLPVLRTVVEPDERAVRKVVTAKSLVPYPGEDREPEVPPTAPEESTTHSPQGDPADEPEPPATYRATLDGGWELRIVQQAAEPSFGERLTRALGDGWRNLRGHPAESRVLLGLAMSEADGRRLHHLLDEGATLLVR